MTQTTSSKGKFKNGFALFKWELKSCRSTLIVFSILAATFITIVFTLSLVVGYTNAIQDGEIDYSQIQNALSVFQYISGYMVFVLTAVFTIVYTIRIYSSRRICTAQCPSAAARFLFLKPFRRICCR